MSWDDRLPNVGEYVIAKDFLGECSNMCLSGEPVRVKAVTIPFCLIESPNGSIHSIDLREWALVRASRDYVKQYFKLLHNAEPEPPMGRRRRKKKPQALGPDFCPNCRRKMIQVRIGPSHWVYRCDKCGRQGGDVPNVPTVPILGGRGK